MPKLSIRQKIWTFLNIIDRLCKKNEKKNSRVKQMDEKQGSKQNVIIEYVDRRRKYIERKTKIRTISYFSAQTKLE